MLACACARARVCVGGGWSGSLFGGRPIMRSNEAEREREREREREGGREERERERKIERERERERERQARGCAAGPGGLSRPGPVGVPSGPGGPPQARPGGLPPRPRRPRRRRRRRYGGCHRRRHSRRRRRRTRGQLRRLEGRQVRPLRAAPAGSFAHPAAATDLRRPRAPRAPGPPPPRGIAPRFPRPPRGIAPREGGIAPDSPLLPTPSTFSLCLISWSPLACRSACVRACRSVGLPACLPACLSTYLFVLLSAYCSHTPLAPSRGACRAPEKTGAGAPSAPAPAGSRAHFGARALQVRCSRQRSTASF